MLLRSYDLDRYTNQLVDVLVAKLNSVTLADLGAKVDKPTSVPPLKKILKDRPDLFQLSKSERGIDRVCLVKEASNVASELDRYTKELVSVLGELKLVTLTDLGAKVDKPTSVPKLKTILKDRPDLFQFSTCERGIKGVSLVKEASSVASELDRYTNQLVNVLGKVGSMTRSDLGAKVVKPTSVPKLKTILKDRPDLFQICGTDRVSLVKTTPAEFLTRTQDLKRYTDQLDTNKVSLIKKPSDVFSRRGTNKVPLPGTQSSRDTTEDPRSHPSHQKDSVFSGFFEVRLPANLFVDDLPVPSTLSVRKTSNNNLKKNFLWLLEDAHDEVVGVDVEVSQNGSVELVQLSTSSRCIMFRPKEILSNKKTLEGYMSFMASAKFAKVGCELRKDALDILRASDGRVRMNRGYDISPAMTTPTGTTIGLVAGFNAAYKTSLHKDKNISRSNWSKALSAEQLEYAALDAWMSYMLGVHDGQRLMKCSKTNQFNVDNCDLSLLMIASKLLVECSEASKASATHRQVDFSNAEWEGKNTCTDGRTRLNVRMSRFETKLAHLDQVVIKMQGNATPLIGMTAGVDGKSALLRLAKSSKASLGGSSTSSIESITITKSAQGKLENCVGLEIRRLFDVQHQPGFVTRKLHCPRSHNAQRSFDASQQLPVLETPPPLWTSTLNTEQSACVNDIIAGSPVSLTLGPPGTGKTTCIAAATWALAHRECKDSNGDEGYNPREFIVVLAQQNVAAMNILKALVSKVNETERGVFGHASLALRCNLKLCVSANYYREWHEHQYEKELEPFMHVMGAKGEEPCIKGYRVINIMTFGTMMTVNQSVLKESKVKAVLVDEASQAWSAISFALDCSFPKLERLHLFGDDNQLPPVLNPSGNNEIKPKSLFDVAKESGHHKLHALRVQHRLPRALADFISKEVYGGMITSGPFVSDSEGAVQWLDTPNGVQVHPSGVAKSNSWINKAEAREVCRQMRIMDSRACSNLVRVVITPYLAQRALIETMSPLSEKNGGPWGVMTVDSYQGREADLVIVSLVRSKAGAGFMSDYRRANVLLSRVKKHMVIVGHWKNWVRANDSRLWRNFAAKFPPSHCGDKGKDTKESLKENVAGSRYIGQSDARMMKCRMKIDEMEMTWQVIEM